MNMLERNTLRIIGEDLDYPDVFTDDAEGMALIRDSVNHAVQEICMTLGTYTRTYHLHLFEGRQFYRVSSAVDHLLYPTLVWDRAQNLKLTQTDLIRVSTDNPYWMQDEGNPKEYMILGLNHIGIVYVPPADGRVLEMTWVCAPAAYTDDSQRVKLREVFQRATVQYAVGEYFASRGDAARATEWHKRYLETAGLGWMVPQHSERQWRFGRYGAWEERI